ncbi:MAG: hypothetical protein ACRECT_05985 [Thermoplasmata archaeon]
MAQSSALGDLSLTGGSHANLAYLLTLIGALLIILGGIVEIAFFGLVGGLFVLLIGFGIVTLVFGLLLLIFALRLKRNPAQTQSTAILIIIFSVISFLGDAVYIGSILALLGGILALLWKPSGAVSAWAPAPGYGTPSAYAAPPPTAYSPAAPPPVAPAPAVAPSPPPPPALPRAPFCPTCGKPGTYIPQYGRFYCYDDQQYL